MGADGFSRIGGTRRRAVIPVTQRAAGFNGD